MNLSQSRLRDYLTCQRRFQLRYLDRLPWPTAPLDDKSAAAIAVGKQFHANVERHYLGVPIPTSSRSPMLQTFLQDAPTPEGKVMVETLLRVPVGEKFFIGRFDLLTITDNALHIYDWKTSKPKSEAELREDWQTRLYLAMIAESGTALREKSIAPEEIAITYWYARQPQGNCTIAYSQAWHEQNWAEILALSETIVQKDENTVWPLTDDLDACGRCGYVTFCDRKPDPIEIDSEQLEFEPEDYDPIFEPAKR